MNKQAVVDVLNELKEEAVEKSFYMGEEWILVKNDEETRSVLNEVGITDEMINECGNDETFCLLALMWYWLEGVGFDGEFFVVE